jgi:hypothetical protein
MAGEASVSTSQASHIPAPVPVRQLHLRALHIVTQTRGISSYSTPAGVSTRRAREKHASNAPPHILKDQH